MPKRKRTTALFDVMSTREPFQPLVKSQGLFHSPSLWSMFQRKPKPHVTIMEPTHADPNDPTYRQPIHHERAVAVMEREPEPAPVAREPRAPREPWLNKFKFEWDWTNGVIAASGAVIVIGLGVLIEHKFRHEPVPTMAATATVSNSTKKPAARPEVLNVPRRPAPVQQVTDSNTGTDSPSDDNDKQTPGKPGERVINMNYVVIQSFPDEKIAQNASDALNKTGVPCTVIAGLTRWAPSPRWYSVVGLKGFGPRTTGTPEFEAYIAKIKEVSPIFAGKSKFNQFKPQLYHWGADSEKSVQ